MNHEIHKLCDSNRIRFQSEKSEKEEESRELESISYANL